MTVLGPQVGAANGSPPKPSSLHSFPSVSLLLLALAVLLVFSSACRKKPTNADVRAITHELVAAAQSATGRRAEIAIRPELQAGAPLGRRQPAAVQDHLYITLDDPNRLRALESAFEQVAQRHHLERVSGSSGPGVIRFDYRWGDRRTHSIHIVTPLGKLQTSVRGSIPRTGPRLAIIIDDLGYDAASADTLLALPHPLTLSVLPGLPHSTQIAEEAERRGYQVLLHLPMESGNGDVKPEANELRRGMDRQEVARLLAAMLNTVPGAAGVNNHQGSLATADPQLMAELMPALRVRGLFFIDSRTTTQTVAYEAAERAGVRAAYRRVFLDDTPTPDEIRRQLARAVHDARRQGWSIAIGHPHPATLATLRDDLPQLEARGIRLVFASDLVQ